MKKRSIVLIVVLLITACFSSFFCWSYYIEYITMPYSKMGKFLEKECDLLKPYYEDKNAYQYIRPDTKELLLFNDAHLSSLNLVEKFNNQEVSYILQYIDTEKQSVNDFQKGEHKSSINIIYSQDRVVWKSYDFLTGKYTTHVSDNSELTASDKQLLEQVESKVSQYISKCK